MNICFILVTLLSYTNSFNPERVSTAWCQAIAQIVEKYCSNGKYNIAQIIDILLKMMTYTF